LTFFTICDIITVGRNARRELSLIAAVASLKRECIFFAFPLRGGDIMDYLTWDDAILIAMLVFAIIACFQNKKK
jgi:hypothetical protein